MFVSSCTADILPAVFVSSFTADIPVEVACNSTDAERHCMATSFDHRLAYRRACVVHRVLHSNESQTEPELTEISQYGIKSHM
jgi:hypothetical protein